MLIYAALIAFLMAYLFFRSLQGWAAALIRIRKFKDLPAIMYMALAIGVFCSFSVIIGMIPGGEVFFVQGILLVLGWIFVYAYRAQTQFINQELKSYFRFSKKDWYWFIFPALYLLVRIFSLTTPHQHNDALYYHLAAPKLWVEMQQIRLLAEHPSHAQATLWETVYAFPMMFLGSNATIITQIFGQILHFFCGQVFSILVGIEILKKTSKFTNPAILLFFSWLLICLPGMEWTSGLAKNDYIAMLFIFSAFLTILKNQLPLAGLFLGFAFATKMSAAPYVLGLSLFAIISEKRNLKVFPRFAAFAFLAVLPILIRNYLFTKNPLFPMFDDVIGPHWIASWWKDHNSSFSGLPSLSTNMIPWVWEKLLEKSLSKILFVLALVSLAYQIVKKQPVKTALLLLAQIVIVISFLRPGADGRYAVPALSLLFLHLIPKIIAKPNFAYGFIPLAFLINIPVDALVKIPKNYFFEPATKYVNQFHAYQEMKNRMNSSLAREYVPSDKPADPVVAIADKANFYLNIPYVTFTEMKVFEELTLKATDANDFLKRLKNANYRYVFLQTHFVYPPHLGRFWDDLILISEKYIIYKAQSTILIDLKLLN